MPERIDKPTPAASADVSSGDPVGVSGKRPAPCTDAANSPQEAQSPPAKRGRVDPSPQTQSSPQVFTADALAIPVYNRNFKTEDVPALRRALGAEETGERVEGKRADAERGPVVGAAPGSEASAAEAHASAQVAVKVSRGLLVATCEARRIRDARGQLGLWATAHLSGLFGVTGASVDQAVEAAANTDSGPALAGKTLNERPLPVETGAQSTAAIALPPRVAPTRFVKASVEAYLTKPTLHVPRLLRIFADRLRYCRRIYPLDNVFLLPEKAEFTITRDSAEPISRALEEAIRSVVSENDTSASAPSKPVIAVEVTEGKASKRAIMDCIVNPAVTGSGCRIASSAPITVILMHLHAGAIGFSVVTRFHDYKKFNLFDLLTKESEAVAKYGKPQKEKSLDVETLKS